MAFIPLLLLLLSCRIQAAAAELNLNLSPDTLTVLRGDEARFTCSTSSKEWTVMVWLLNGTAALTISNTHGVLASTNPNVTAEKSPSSKGDSWVFVLKSTEWHNQGQVTCDLQGIERKTANLFVQEKGSVTVFGDDTVAFRGQAVLFECKATGWFPEPTLQWQVNDKQGRELRAASLQATRWHVGNGYYAGLHVNDITLSLGGGEVSRGEYNISRERSRVSFFTVTSNLSVTAAKSSHVDCLASVSALPSPLKSRVRLTVVAEVTEEGDACTVPLVVTSSLSVLLLLLLLCICTVLCYRRRREAKTGPQEALRVDPSVHRRISVAEATGGKINLGFSSEGPTDAVKSELVMGSHSQMDFVSFHKVPDVAYSSSQRVASESQAQVCLEEEKPTTRSITTV